jgi:hypothetical protein
LNLSKYSTTEIGNIQHGATSHPCNFLKTGFISSEGNAGSIIATLWERKIKRAGQKSKIPQSKKMGE